MVSRLLPPPIGRPTFTEAQPGLLDAGSPWAPSDSAPDRPQTGRPAPESAIRKRFLIKFAAVIAAELGLSLSPAFASQQTGNVNMVTSSNNNGGFGFSAVGTRTTKPACATDDLWIIPYPTTDTSKAIYAEALSALLTGRTVYIAGTGTCTAQPTREDVAYLNVQ